MSTNGIMMQYFEWHSPKDGKHWKRLKEDADHLKELGVTSVWIPPCFKTSEPDDQGYKIYDLYDLGEFDQKGSVRTKYGTKEELHEAIDALHENGIQVYADIVLNHKAGADEKQRFEAVEVDEMNRTEILTDPYEIEGWTKFTFPGRNGTYSDFEWSWEHFNGVDYNAENDKEAIYMIQGENKGWADGVDEEFGNYDYLMFASIDYRHPEVYEETMKWASWFVKETKVDGFRLDAIKHINDWFMKDLMEHVREEAGEEFFAVGEYWHGESEVMSSYLENTGYNFSLFDVTLHYKFHEASLSGDEFDLRTLFEGTLVEQHPELTVTFVDNHDSQPEESLESFVGDEFKPLAYGVILLRKEGYPTLFYGDYYGINGDNPVEGKKEILDKLLYLRSNHAYGKQEDYFEEKNCIGWTRSGNEEHPFGAAVILSNADENELKMHVGPDYAGQRFADYTGNREDKIEIDEEGNGIFPVNAMSISVWIKDDVEPEEAFEGELD